MKLKVLKCKDQQFWYHDHIGEYFNVINQLDDVCSVHLPSNTSRAQALVLMDDALIFRDEDFLKIEGIFTRLYDDLNQVALNQLKPEIINTIFNQ